MIVDLTHAELRIAYDVGFLRDQANLHKSDAAHYDPTRMEDNLRASIASAVCECAVAKATHCYWSMSAWDSAQHHLYRNEPDVYPGIEVRRVRQRQNPLVVRQRDSEKQHVIVTAYAEAPMFRSVDVRGWLPAPRAWELGDPAPYDPSKKTRLVDQEHLLPVEEMFQDLVML